MQKSKSGKKKLSFYDKNLTSIYNTQRHPPYVKSQRLPPISFNTQLTNIKKKWNTTPLYSGIIGSNYSTLLKNKEKPRHPTTYNTYNYVPQVKNYKNEISKSIQMNRNNIIKSRFPDKCLGNRFATEAGTNYNKTFGLNIMKLYG